MGKDLRGRDKLRASYELAEVAALPQFNDVDVIDLRQLAGLIRGHAGGSLAGITVESAHAFAGLSRHKYQCIQRALRQLVGTDHAATKAVETARSLHGQKKRRRTGARHRDSRPRDAILMHPRWEDADLRGTAETMPIMELRAVDRFAVFCEARGLSGECVEDFLAFVADQESSTLLRTLRDGLEKLYSSTHPAIVLVERARGLKDKQSRVRLSKGNKSAASLEPAKPLSERVSLPCELLSGDWRDALSDLAAGFRVRGVALRPKSVETVRYAASQLGWSAQKAGLPLKMNLETLRAYDRDLRARGNRASSRQIHFAALLALGRALGADADLLQHLLQAATYCGRLARADVKLKEARLDGLADLAEIFALANQLLDEASTVTDRRRLAALRSDAAALAILSLVPLRNKDTQLRWGDHVLYVDSVNPIDPSTPQVGHYRLDLITSKTGSHLSGPLAPILTPFLDAMILQGRHEALLPGLRRDVMLQRDPVFPKSNGGMRHPNCLSARWRHHVGTGSIISRTRVHTLLGMMGERGVRAALALCAQSSPRTAAWYQAEALRRRQMVKSQELIDSLLMEATADIEDIAA